MFVFCVFFVDIWVLSNSIKCESFEISGALEESLELENRGESVPSTNFTRLFSALSDLLCLSSVEVSR